MILIPCPWCGERDKHEFTAHGQALITRPPNPEKISDQEWGNYLFFRHNKKGYYHEQWHHSLGCRRWFYMLRNTKTDTCIKAYKPNETPPQPPKT